ncbi:MULTISPECIES: type IV pili methyl-accepting chemotaxis transducer N-terminal domain-containing protein [unclassified Acidovorax]|uniref:type IV pili methyl-accepting chemotaxis transducer N-terminal domain-containing protein n=1 Tax=unclassified Acidovorax TaxID=2684926 RepID=UPI0028832332|nr:MULTISPECIES: type IV pili methyl-accepting chemotaxis transducer N-terminal domain-containing protein [unclassified Acidovorax]
MTSTHHAFEVPSTQRRTVLRAAGALCAVALLPNTVWAAPAVADLNDAINQAGRQRMLSQRMAKAWLALTLGVEGVQARTVLDRSVALFERQLAALKAYAPTAEIRSTYTELEAAWATYRQALVGAAASPAAAPALLQADARVLALAHQGTVQYEAAQAQPVGHLVNIAGRQRMLSQRMAKFCLAAALRVDAAGAQAEITRSRTEFLQAMQTLRSAPQATPRILQELQLADGQWVFFNAALQRIQAGTDGGRALPDVFVASENLLAVMDQVTGLYAAVKG